MKHITHSGVTYEVEDGWEGMESVTGDDRFVVLYANGEYGHESGYTQRTGQMWGDPIAWRPIVAPRVVEPVRRFEVANLGEANAPWRVYDSLTGHRMAISIPTPAAAEEIAAIYEREYRNA